MLANLAAKAAMANRDFVRNLPFGRTVERQCSPQYEYRTSGLKSPVRIWFEGGRIWGWWRVWVKFVEGTKNKLDYE